MIRLRIWKEISHEGRVLLCDPSWLEADSIRLSRISYSLRATSLLLSYHLQITGLVIGFPPADEITAYEFHLAFDHMIAAGAVFISRADLEREARAVELRVD
jgi:hypothetical protein